MTRVLIVDDQLFPRQLFEGIIKGSEEYELIASIASARMADSYCVAGKVDLIIMDIVMNDGVSGLESAEKIKKSYPEVKIILVTSMSDSSFVERARKAGVDSFWYKEVQEAPLLDVMTRTMAGEQVYPENLPSVAFGNAESTDFTERELEVLRLLSSGYSDKEIADTLVISLSTVRFHVNNLISKTGYASRTELAIYAVKTGIVVPGV